MQQKMGLPVKLGISAYHSCGEATFDVVPQKNIYSSKCSKGCGVSASRRQQTSQFALPETEAGQKQINKNGTLIPLDFNWTLLGVPTSFL